MQESDGDALAGLGSDDEEAFVDGDDEDDDGKVRDAAASFHDLEYSMRHAPFVVLLALAVAVLLL